MRSIASVCLAASILATASFGAGAFALPANGTTIGSPDTNFIQVKMTHKKKMKKSKMDKPATSDTKPMDSSGGKSM